MKHFKFIYFIFFLILFSPTFIFALLKKLWFGESVKELE